MEQATTWTFISPPVSTGCLGKNFNLALQFFSSEYEDHLLFLFESPSLSFFRMFWSYLMVKNPPGNAGETGLIPGPGRSHLPRGNWAIATEPVLQWPYPETGDATAVRSPCTATKCGSHSPKLEDKPLGTNDDPAQRQIKDCPGSPVVRTPCFHSRGTRVRSLVGELRSHVLPDQINKP